MGSNRAYFTLFIKKEIKIDYGRFLQRSVIEQDIDNDVDTDEEELKAVKQRALWNIKKAIDLGKDKRSLI